MKQAQKKYFLYFFLLLLILPFACVKEDFDEPDVQGEFDPEIETNASIEDLQQFWQEGQYVTIDEDLVLDAVVIADDESGNYYRNIVIEDETGGLLLLINARDLHNDFPIGRKVYLRAQDLIISDYNGLIQLGGSTYTDDNGNLRLGGIEESLMEKYVIKGPRGQEVSPEVKTIPGLSFGDVSTLVTIENVEFLAADTAETYADAEGLQTRNRTLVDCEGNELVVRSSGFADFADVSLPNGNGSITGVYSVFGSVKQMYIRDLNDVDMDGARCDGTGGGDCDFDGTLTDIGDVRSEYSGSASNLPNDIYIEGTVISDRNGGNIDSRNMVVQGADQRGIVLRFSNEHTYNLNDQVRINVGGEEISEYNGWLQVNNVPLAKSCKIGSQNVSPQVVTISEVLSDFENYESTLVQIDNVLLSKESGDDWVFVVTLDDGTGEIDMFTTPGANWADDSFPTDSLRMTAYVSQGGNEESMQVAIRNLNDVVVIGGNGGNDGGTVDENFESGANDEDVNLPGWTNQNVEGERKWRFKEFEGNTYAQMTAYNSDDTRNEGWLVTPTIDTDEGNILSFESAMAFYNHDGLSVWISTNFSGDVTSASWTEITEEFDIAGQNNDDHEWIPSGNLDLSQFGNEVSIGFKYVGSPDNQTTSYRIDNVKVE